MLRFCLGLLAALAWATPARADFVITPFIVSLLTAAGVSATAATVAASIIVTGALVGAALLLAKRPKVPEPSDGKVLTKSAIPPKQWGVGTSRTCKDQCQARKQHRYLQARAHVPAPRMSRLRHVAAGQREPVREEATP